MIFALKKIRGTVGFPISHGGVARPWFSPGGRHRFIGPGAASEHAADQGWPHDAVWKMGETMAEFMGIYGNLWELMGISMFHGPPMCCKVYEKKCEFTTHFYVKLGKTVGNLDPMYGKSGVKWWIHPRFLVWQVYRVMTMGGNGAPYFHLDPKGTEPRLGE